MSYFVPQEEYHRYVLNHADQEEVCTSVSEHVPNPDGLSRSVPVLDLPRYSTRILNGRKGYDRRAFAASPALDIKCGGQMA